MIELSGVSFSYPDGTKALSEINLVIDEGEFVVVCGPTGCGKSTLLMTVNGLIPHTVSGEYQGEARVAGRVVRDVSVAGLAAHVGTVFQNPEAQIFSLTCEDEIAFGLENLSLSPREIDKRINHVLHLLSLDSLRRRRTAELSGGEKQKLVIAATLAMGPRVLVLDEPLSDLDPEGKITVLNTIARLNREGMTIVMAEHNLDRIRYDHGGSVLYSCRPVKSSKQVLKIVPINLSHSPSERTPLIRERQRRHHLFDRAVDLKTVIIKDGCQVACAVMGSSHGCLPDLPLLALTIT
jgi:energy-coupling factor transporter ATP-binding protein EcfA2